MRSTFPLFQSHLDLAHSYWGRLLKPGDVCIDATCGNGHDTLLLAQLALMPNRDSSIEVVGKLYALDLQQEAITKSSQLLQAHLPSSAYEKVQFHHQSHATFPSEILHSSVSLIVYNLGYLPGGNKTCTTQVETTLQSLQNALPLLKLGGCISLTAYPGHAQGKEEEQALFPFFAKLPPHSWNVCHHRFCNRTDAPSLFLIQRCK